MWIAGLPAAVCGWKLEAEKHAGDNPPAEPGAGYNLAYTAGRGIIQCIASDASRRSIFAAAVFLCFYGIGGGIGVSILFKSLSKGFVVADAHSGPVFFGGELEVKSAGPCLRRGTSPAREKYRKARQKSADTTVYLPFRSTSGIFGRMVPKFSIVSTLAPLPLTL